MQPTTKRNLIAIAAALVVALVVFVSVLVVLIRGSDPRPVSVTAYSHGSTVEVTPYLYCTVNLEDCSEEGTIAPLDVPAGMPLQLSLPSEISSAPWRLLTVYQGPNGEPVVQARIYLSNDASAVTVPSTPELPLVGVEIQLPSAVVDEQGQPKARAVWAVGSV
ncbi:DUF2771 domain-containing protein [Rhodococcus sp. HNM0569]|nr:DUF2771 domain-containing protein [Rhodococcus sp. HNM0569]